VSEFYQQTAGEVSQTQDKLTQIIAEVEINYD